MVLEVVVVAEGDDDDDYDDGNYSTFTSNVRCCSHAIAFAFVLDLSQPLEKYSIT